MNRKDLVCKNMWAHESYKKWLKSGKPKIICICGCGNEIIIKKHHRIIGITKFIRGHNFSNYYRKNKIPWNKGKKYSQKKEKIFIKLKCKYCRKDHRCCDKGKSFDIRCTKFNKNKEVKINDKKTM